jgi:hypothetical protein
MSKNPDPRSRTLSVLLGALLGVTGFVLLGAAPKKDVGTKIMPQRFLVLKATPLQNPANPEQSVLQLKVSPHYGKIDAQGLKFKMANETQELTLLMNIEEAGEEIRRGDIISFEGFKHIQFGPGSQTIRHLPSGGTELVP